MKYIVKSVLFSTLIFSLISSGMALVIKGYTLFGYVNSLLGVFAIYGLCLIKFRKDAISGDQE